MGNSGQDLRKEALAVYFRAFLTVSDFFPSVYSASSRGGPGIRGALASRSAGGSYIPVILIRRVRGPWCWTCVNLTLHCYVPEIIISTVLPAFQFWRPRETLDTDVLHKLWIHRKYQLLGLPRWHSREKKRKQKPTCQCRRCKRCRFNPWVGKIPWRRKWQPTPVIFCVKSHRQRSLLGSSPWDCKELGTTEHSTAAAAVQQIVLEVNLLTVKLT